MSKPSAPEEQNDSSSSDDNEEFENASSVLPNDNDAINKATEQHTDVEEEASGIHIDDESRRDYEANLSPSELMAKKEEAILLKAKGNDLFKSEDYTAAVEKYTEAIELCPLNCVEEQSVLHGNRAAANLQLNNKAAAISGCTKSLELNPKYMKVLLRRAKLYEDTDKLDESLEDFKQILELDPQCSDARQAVHRLPGKIDERNEKLKTEMMGKLKDLGNMILKPFGLSTNNFQMQQDPNSGSYSVNFNQNPSK